MHIVKMKKTLLLIMVLVLSSIALARVGTEKAYNPLISSKLDMIFSGDMNGENLDLKGSNLTNVSYINPDGETTYFGGNVSTTKWFKGFLNWSDVQNKFITAVDNIYIYMSGTTATFNITKAGTDLTVNHSNSTTYWNTVPTNYLGSDCNGSSPDQNRALSTSGVTFIYLDGLLLQNSTQYTTSNNIITFLVNVKDSHRITVVN